MSRPPSTFASVWPVIQRELRAGSRGSVNFWLRVAASGLASLFVFIASHVITDEPPATIGKILFYFLHCLLLLLILVTVPAMTADCIAREKREGTLGLLFLTPLTARGIVVGKTLVQALRAWNLWLAMLPTLTIPFMMGGVMWWQIITAVDFELCAVLIALAAGFMASSLAKTRNVAFFLAEALTGCLSLFFLFLVQTHFTGTIGMYYSSGPLASLAPGLGLVSGFADLTNGSQVARYGLSTSDWTWFLIVFVVFAFLVLLLSLFLSANRIQASWRDKPPTPREQWWAKHFCTVLFRDQFKRASRATLDSNPIVWLQQYSWKARAAKWGLCLLFVVAQTLFALSSNLYKFNGFSELVEFLLVILAGIYTFVGVGSFLTEKKSGALELILITPLRVNHIISGRARGLWMLFLPAGLSLFLFHLALLWIGGHWKYQNEINNILLNTWLFVLGFFAFPFFATYAALRVKNLVLAGALAWLGILLSVILGTLLTFYLADGSDPSNHPVAFILCNSVASLACVALTFFLLRHSLSRRIYSF